MSYRCEHCGGPMERLTSGGVGDDGKKATTQLFGCKAARDEYVRRQATALRQLGEEMREHTRIVQLPWPKEPA